MGAVKQWFRDGGGCRAVLPALFIFSVSFLFVGLKAIERMLVSAALCELDSFYSLISPNCIDFRAQRTRLVREGLDLAAPDCSGDPLTLLSFISMI